MTRRGRGDGNRSARRHGDAGDRADGATTERRAGPAVTIRQYPARHVPAAEHHHGRQHVLRLRVRRVCDAQRTGHGRAVHRHRGRPRHARRAHRPHDEHRRARSAWSSTRWPTSFRSAGARRSSRSPGGCRSSGAIGLGGRDSSTSRPPPCGSRASTSRSTRAGRQALSSSACRRRRRPASWRPPSSLAVSAAWGIRRPWRPWRLVLIPAVLMVSTIRFRSFKTINFGWSAVLHPTSFVVAGLIAFVATEPRITLLIFAYAYLLVGVHRDGPHASSAVGGRSRAPADSVTVTVVPRPGALAIVIVPPSRSTLRLRVGQAQARAAGLRREVGFERACDGRRRPCPRRCRSARDARSRRRPTSPVSAACRRSGMA